MKNQKKITLKRPESMSAVIAKEFGVPRTYVCDIAAGKRRCVRGKALAIRQYLESLNK